MYDKQRQRGLTLISWLVIFVVAGFFIMVALRITPVYLEHFAVKQSLESLKNEPFIGRKSIGEIRKMLQHRLDVNSVRRIGKDQIKITRTGGVTTVAINYEERRPVMGNLSMVMTFDDSIELISN